MELIPMSRKILIHRNGEYDKLSNFGNRENMRPMQRGRNGRYRIEMYMEMRPALEPNRYWIVLIDKKDRWDPVFEICGNSYADCYLKFSTTSLVFRDLCRRYGVYSREISKLQRLKEKGR